MRILRVQMAGLAVALVGAAAADDASANDVTVSTATTNPLLTSAPDGASPGDVTITSTGSIAVTAGQTAITVDSNNDVSNAGTLSSSDANNTTGILLQGGFAGPQVITHSGAISLLETYARTDSDSDGDLDGAFAAGTNRHGILLNGVGAFNGDITSSGAISIEGTASAGIQLETLLNGDLTSTGVINVVGENSTGIAILGGAGAGVSGDVFARGSFAGAGEGVRGVFVGAPVGGALRINGAWAVTGYTTTARPADVSKLDADDLRQGGSPIDVRFSVANGITIEGIGVEDDLDDDGDGLLDNGADANDDASASISVFGSAPAILIQADPSANLVLGPTASTYGLHVRGGVSAVGVYDGVDATAIRIEGAAGSSVTTAAGVALDSVISATAIEADSYGLYLGNNASAPSVQIRRSVSSAVGAETAQDAYGIFLAAGANAPSLSNSGVLSARLLGEVGDASAIVDLSNTLATITNSGTISASVTATDTNLNDDIPPPPVTGSAIAVDVSASTIAVTLNQIADTPFTDDDTVDDDASTRPAVKIEGDIRFGSGADVFNLLAGSVSGDVSFGAGADTFTVNNGASYTGRVDDSDGALTLNVVNGSLALDGGALNLTSASFGAQSTLQVVLSETPGAATFIHSSGDITFLSGASLRANVPPGLPASGSITFLTADGTLNGGNFVTGPITGAGSPWLYNFQVSQVANSLLGDFALKTAAQLNLSANQGAVLTPLIDAMRPNSAAAAAFASIDNEADFFDAYEDLMPSYAAASTELAATGIQQAQSATSNRLSATRLQGLDEVSVWAQEIGYALTRTPLTPNGQEYDGNGFGFALGIDAPLKNGALFGLSGSLLASEAKDEGRPDGEIASIFGQANAYLGTAMGPIDLDLIAGLGVGQMTSRRVVDIGADFRTTAEAEWLAYEGHAAVRASAPMKLADWFVVTPQAALTYVYMTEEGYTEQGGGAGIDYDSDTANTQRLWGDAGIELSGRFRLGGAGVLAPRLFAGYRSNLTDGEAERTFRFASGGPDFTLIDETSGDGAPLVSLGVDGSNGFSTVSLTYEGEFGDQIERHSLNAAVRFRF